jgi:hypothetical protein
LISHSQKHSYIINLIALTTINFLQHQQPFSIDFYNMFFFSQPTNQQYIYIRPPMIDAYANTTTH